VAAATSHAAEHLGLRAIGSVAPGWVADLLLVDGDPLEDLRALTRVRLVSRAGWIAG
jgi:imidazolonepropionase-like amidohydrolase